MNTTLSVYGRVKKRDSYISPKRGKDNGDFKYLFAMKTKS